MSMHNSFRNDTTNPPGQIVNFSKPLVEELKKTQLWELPRKSYFKFDKGSLLNRPDNPVYFLDHIDGMYSYCLDKDNNVVHFAAWCEVVPIETKE